MLDLRYIKENHKLVKDNIKKRFQENKLAHVDNIIPFHNEWITLKKESDNLRAKRNRISQEINNLKKQGKDISEKLKEAEQIPDKIAEIEKRRQLL